MVDEKGATIPALIARMQSGGEPAFTNYPGLHPDYMLGIHDPIGHLIGTPGVKRTARQPVDH